MDNRIITDIIDVYIQDLMVHPYYQGKGIFTW